MGMQHITILSNNGISSFSSKVQGNDTSGIDIKWPTYEEKLELFMYHKGGKKFLLDVERSTAFQISELIWDLLKKYRGLTVEEVIKYLESSYDRSDIIDALKEVNCVQSIGLLMPTEPSIQYRLPDSYIQNFSIEHLFLYVTDNCNLRCSYCRNEAEFKGLGSMSTHIARASINFLLESSANNPRCIVEFFGGEPLLNMVVITDTVEYAEEQAKKLGKEIKFVLTTNGTLLTDKIIDFLQKHNILTMVSLDGPRELHDGCRKFPNGRGSFNIMFPKVQKLLRVHKSNTIAVSTLTHYSAKECERIISFMKESGFKTVYMSPVNVHIPSNLDRSPEYALTSEDRQWIRRGYANVLQSPTGELLNIDFQGIGATLGLIHRKEKRYYGCPRRAGISMLAVNPNGDVYPCSNLFSYEQYKLGNLLTGVHKMDVRRRFIENSVDDTACRRCWARYLCGGRCSVEGILLLGDPKKVATEKCRITRSAIKESIALYARLHEENPERLEELCSFGIKL